MVCLHDVRRTVCRTLRLCGGVWHRCRSGRRPGADHHFIHRAAVQGRDHRDPAHLRGDPPGNQRQADADAKKNNQIDPNQLYFTPEKKLVVAVSQDEYEAMKEAGTLDEDVLYVTPASESVTIPEATETTAGLMPPSAVTKLKGIDEGANKYTHPTHTARASGLYKITVDSLGHVIAVSAVQKSDITNLGIPSSNTTYGLASASSNGLMSSTQYSKLSGIESGGQQNHGR
uniref:Uncharacterized protein n=1 Tax=Ackermannviridae sp. TaxID=2831612 RepID=A0A8S5VIM3_9CAUD|nr:MAG TPA: hypothetical protein [Ackermannviridae sp.]